MISSTNNQNDRVSAPEISYEDERGALSLLVWLLGGSKKTPKSERPTPAQKQAQTSATGAHPMIHPAHAS